MRTTAEYLRQCEHQKLARDTAQLEKDMAEATCATCEYLEECRAVEGYIDEADPACDDYEEHK